MNVLNKMLWQFGLTEETKIESSELLQEPVSVVSKKYEEESVMSGELHIMAWKEILKKYSISFKSKRKNREISLTFDNKELFEAFNEGDEAVLNYIIVREASYNYLPPDFRSKERSGRKFMTYVPLSIKSDKLQNGAYDIPENVKEKIFYGAYRRQHPE